MKKLSTACLVCKAACYQNQRVICCTTCKSNAHLNCSKVGENFGNHNYVCTRCHHKKALIAELVKSTCTAIDEEDQIMYHSIESMNKIQNRNAGDISIVHVNARSLVLNFDSIVSFLEKVNLPEIICVSETRLKDNKINWQSKLVTIPNYDLIYDNSPTNAGGVAIYVKNKIFSKFEIKADLKLDLPQCESLFLEIKVSTKSKSAHGNMKTLLVGCVYPHPKLNSTLFIDHLCNMLGKYTDRNVPVVIVGDLNIDVSKTLSDTVQHFKNMLCSIGCANIKIHTRFGSHQKGN